MPPTIRYLFRDSAGAWLTDAPATPLGNTFSCADESTFEEYIDPGTAKRLLDLRELKAGQQFKLTIAVEEVGL